MFNVFAAWVTLNSRRVTSTLVRLLKDKERWEIPDHPQDVIPQNWSGTKSNRTVFCVCMVLKAMTNDRCKLLAPYQGEYKDTPANSGFESQAQICT
ncbi:hypothetical protein TNCV_603461 [Trichonephila clavipes]|nr:hypothetical protein TNCV_603461 [Trichonephila clavipes]